jgi:hypothetical protein
MRETDKSNAKTFGTRPLVIYRVRIFRTLSGGLPEGKSDTQMSKVYTLYSDAFSSIPRMEDIAKMAEDLYSADYPNVNVFSIDNENGLMSQVLEIFHNIEGCDGLAARYYYSYFFEFISTAISYSENTRDFTVFGFTFDEFANILASRKEEEYILSKTKKFKLHELVSVNIEEKFNHFLSRVKDIDRNCEERARQKFIEWGGMEKLKTLLDLTLTTQIIVTRISNPQKITYGSEGGSMGKRRRE